MKQDKLTKNLGTWSKYQDGYKTQELGKHTEVANELLKRPKKVLQPSDKVIFSVLKLQKSEKTQRALLSFQSLAKKSGYSVRKCKTTVEKLQKLNYLNIEKGVTQKVIKGEIQYVHYNIYEFLDGGNFERFTPDFLYSKEISKSTKEFLVLLMPYLLPNDTIGYSNSKLSEILGLGRNAVINATKELTEMKVLGKVLTTGFRMLDTYALYRKGMKGLREAYIESQEKLTKAGLE